MQSESLSIEPRNPGGKGAARQLRRGGRTPAVVYGHGLKEPLHVSIDPAALSTALQNPKGANALFSVDCAGGTHSVMIREVQRHPVSRHILHVDLVAPDPERPLLLSIPVRLTGRSIGASTGGIVRNPSREVRLLVLPAIAPAAVMVDITDLDHGDSIMASELQLPEETRAVYDRDYVVVKIVKPRGQLEDEKMDEGDGDGERADDEAETGDES